MVYFFIMVAIIHPITTLFIHYIIFMLTDSWFKYKLLYDVFEVLLYSQSKAEEITYSNIKGRLIKHHYYQTLQVIYYL